MMPKKPKPIYFVSDPNSDRPAPGYRRLVAELPFLGNTAAVALDTPEARIGLADIMPAAWAISEHLTDLAVAEVLARGETIPCRKGCKECCRAFLVTCSPPEAFRILDDIQSLSPPARRRFLSSLSSAADQYAKSGVAQAAARNSDDHNAASNVELSAAYWRKTCFDCPILRDGACGLYGSRPTACREFLVTSDPELCTTYKPTRVPIPFSMEMTLSIWAGQIEQLKPTLVPLPNILAWSGNKTTRAARTWRAIGAVQSFLDILTDRAKTAADKQEQSP